MSDYNDKVKAKILVILEKTKKPLWINAIHKELIKAGFDISVPTIAKLIRELEEADEVKTSSVGNAIQVARHGKD